MPQSLLTGQQKEKPTYRVWCLYSSFVHAFNPFLPSLMVAQAPLLASTISMAESEAMVDDEGVWTAHNLSAHVSKLCPQGLEWPLREE
jgi:hypothetical protein